jgi:hypothetical protein
VLVVAVYAWSTISAGRVLSTRQPVAHAALWRFFLCSRFILRLVHISELLLVYLATCTRYAHAHARVQVRAAAGISLEQAMEAGWVLRPTVSGCVCFMYGMACFCA